MIFMKLTVDLKSNLQAQEIELLVQLTVALGTPQLCHHKAGLMTPCPLK
jgi:hypothetical protein